LLLGACPRERSTPSFNVGADGLRNRTAEPRRTPVSFRLQLFVSGHWRLALTTRSRLGARSRATIRLVYGSPNLIGVRSRIRAEFPPDGDHLAGVSTWKHFMVTR